VDAAYRRFGPGAPWAQRHIANCPRCQRRLAALGKVDIALSVIKSQPHRLDLLMRANDAAIHMLSRRLRETAEADRLKQAQPEPSLAERLAGPQNALVNLAACLAVLALARTGIFTSLDKAHTRGRAAMKQYYTNHAGEDLADEIFRT
jgi:anti-sigma factor RsiW